MPFNTDPWDFPQGGGSGPPPPPPPPASAGYGAGGFFLPEALAGSSSPSYGPRRRTRAGAGNNPLAALQYQNGGESGGGDMAWLDRLMSGGRAGGVRRGGTPPPNALGLPVDESGNPSLKPADYLRHFSGDIFSSGDGMLADYISGLTSDSQARERSAVTSANVFGGGDPILAAYAALQGWLNTSGTVARGANDARFQQRKDLLDFLRSLYSSTYGVSGGPEKRGRTPAGVSVGYGPASVSF